MNTIPAPISLSKRSESAAASYMGTNEVPRTYSGTVIHLDVQEGQVANRIITVGDSARALRIAKSLDEVTFKHMSSRGFQTITGSFEGTPVSIVSIGMGMPNMDFMLREIRQVIKGPMLCVRYGTCGGLTLGSPEGSICVATQGSICVQRNPDAFTSHRHSNPESKENGMIGKEVGHGIEPYLIFGVQESDPELSRMISSELRGEVGDTCVVECMNVTSDSFYSSQGRKDPNFDDRNEDIVEKVVGVFPNAKSMEMETFQLLALSNSSFGVIRASAASIVKANRVTGKVCSEESVTRLEEFGGRAILRALTKIRLEV